MTSVNKRIHSTRRKRSGPYLAIAQGPEGGQRDNISIKMVEFLGLLVGCNSAASQSCCVSVSVCFYFVYAVLPLLLVPLRDRHTSVPRDKRGYLRSVFGFFSGISLFSTHQQETQWGKNGTLLLLLLNLSVCVLTYTI